MQMAARFADLPEANVASSMLRAYGLHPEIPETNHGGIDWGISSALGGYRLMVPDEELEAAVELIGPCRQSEPQALKWTNHPEAVSGAALAGLGLAVGWPAAAIRKRRDTVRWIGFLMGVAAAALLGATWFLHDG
jgi:hypothetical protein